MNSLPPCFGIIPARFDSERFPGKPLAEILGKPMFWHVYRRARQCPEMVRVVLATDDERIRAAAAALGVEVVMTRRDHPSGTDRVLEAAQKLRLPPNSIVVNIQGDEPALNPDLLTQLIQPFRSSAVQVTTPVRKIPPAEAENPDRVKVVFSKSRRAIYFSRAPIPYGRDGRTDAYFGHIGLYAFRMTALEGFVALDPSVLETTEKLEQLRLLENDIPIHVVVTAYRSLGVDRPEDLETVIQMIEKTNRT
jgi:3-deoxy-manno-octulosonate cytidylyltransferase (CMP-KDO synthetase)